MKALNTKLDEGKKRDKDTVRAKASILMISRESPISKRKSLEEPVDGIGKNTFPPVSGSNNSSDSVIIKVCISGRQVNRAYMDSGSSCEVIYEHCFLKLNPSIKALRVDSNIPLVGFSREHSWPLGEEKVIVNEKHSEQMVIIGKQLPASFKKKLQDLLRSNTDVFAWTYADMTGIPRTITVGGKPFITEHKLNEYKHIKPIKQKKRVLGPDRNGAACKEVDDLTKARILRKVKDHTWGQPSHGIEKHRGLEDVRGLHRHKQSLP
ncbi:hypothetical protein Tco_0603371 [Tanacetum coccineum]